jgi:regulator of cell morphogenesis and NO signaling
MAIFNETVKKLIPTLEKFVPIVARVHGKHHPEFHDVRKVFDTIFEKVKEAGTEKPELSQEFTKLREITGNYTVPGDVCESYEAVYKMLAELDEAYHA